MPAKGDRRRQRIQATIVELLANTSYDDISIAEITRRAEVTRPGFYFYFPTKGAAVASLMEGLFAEFTEAARIWYDHAMDDQVEALRGGMAATVDLWRKHAPAMHGMVQASAADPHAAETWERWIAAFTARAVPTIAADVGPRVRSAGTTVEDVARFLVDATFGAMRRDVRALLEKGEGSPHVVETLVLVWAQTLYS
jgi:AcrR family transcriptional regulator